MQENGYAVFGVANAKMSFSNVCFIDNEFVGSGVVVLEGSIDDFTSSDVTGPVDPNLECSYASIGFSSCVDYDTSTCATSNPSDGTAPTVPVPNVVPSSAPIASAPDAAPTNEGKTSGCFPTQTKISLLLLLISVVLAL
jgi:hypothetical protein